MKAVPRVGDMTTILLLLLIIVYQYATALGRTLRVRLKARQDERGHQRPRRVDLGLRRPQQQERRDEKNARQDSEHLAGRCPGSRFFATVNVT